VGIYLFATGSRTAMESNQSPVQWVPAAFSLGVKRPGCEADHSPASRAEIKNAWSYTSTPQYTFLAWCSVKKTQCQRYLLHCSSGPEAIDIGPSKSGFHTKNDALPTAKNILHQIRLKDDHIRVHENRRHPVYFKERLRNINSYD